MLAVSRSELFGCAGCDDDAVAEAAGRFLNVKNYVKIMECELAKTRVKIGENLFFVYFWILSWASFAVVMCCLSESTEPL